MQSLIQELNTDPELNDVETTYIFFYNKHWATNGKHFPLETLSRKQQEHELKLSITKGIFPSTRVKAKLFKTTKKTEITHLFQENIDHTILLDANIILILSILYLAKVRNSIKKNTLLKMLIIFKEHGKESVIF